MKLTRLPVRARRSGKPSWKAPLTICWLRFNVSLERISRSLQVSWKIEPFPAEKN